LPRPHLAGRSPRRARSLTIAAGHLASRLESPRAAWRDALSPISTSLLNEWLPRWLPERRWFQAKSRAIRSLSLRDGCIIDAAAHGMTILTLLDIATSDSRPLLYQLPLTLNWSAATASPAVSRIGSEMIEGRRVDVLDGLADPCCARRMLDVIGRGDSLTTEQGAFVGRPGLALATMPGASAGEAVSVSTAEQSHTNVVFGDRLLLKVLRALEPGTHPDIEISRFLTERTSFHEVPRWLGSIEYVARGNPDDEVEPIATAMLQEFVPNLGQGWTWMLGLLAESLDACWTQTDGGSDVAGHMQSSLADVRLLALRTAQLHDALASVGDDSDFAPEPFAAEDWHAQRDAILVQAERTSRSIASANQPFDPTLFKRAHASLEAVPRWLALRDQALDNSALGLKQRIHGDLHLGQTLRTDSDFVFLDFEGEPSKPIEARRRKQSPLRDVAGMLRSFDYAAFSALEAAKNRHPARAQAVAASAREWVARASSSFLSAYAQARGTSTLNLALLDLMLVEKALYELDYELNNRPSWIGMPLAGLERLLALRADAR
jgi:maltose alpha-D-glucosyltransferase/alpha-amylase